ncbi:hypothetical protein [Methylibium petroleiphilum]|uniref:Uncharacterized protein n=1 Tax=Methylibium petroleiphilum (strain ATCC BAA-1232 / LMG 22953 / PM1) TaxID=420662 RepID=A2SMR4_METPP|nr:hypothetical protein [Methylibium petroleiphilum]ABM96853.1 hypothetical protein Mpe_B0074 [Methylibium petroleiphilum PM1]
MPDDLNDFPRRGMLRDRDHQRLDDLLTALLADLAAGAVTADQVRIELAHLIGAVDIGNRTEVDASLDLGRKRAQRR